jgi:phage shock protein E
MVDEITSDDYIEQFVNNPTADYVLIDVREPDEYEDGHIANAQNIPMSVFQADFADIPPDKTVVLVCAKGGRSAMAADFLAMQGYDDLYNLVDGTLGWMLQGKPLDK